MNKIFAIIFVFILLSSCIIEKEKIKLMYVCHDSSIVSNPRECPIIEKKVINITKYICYDGEIVNSVDECRTINKISTTTIRTSGIITQNLTRNDIPTTPPIERVTTTKIKTTKELTTTRVTTMTTTTSITTQIETTTTTQTTTTEVITTTTLEENLCVSLFGCPEGTKFVGSKSSDKYHYCWCRYAKNIKAENIICFSGVEDAKSKNYTACGTCKPPY
ncbi:MAG: hypothetical protein QXY62_05485 [Candidatus Altiarchaeota archaeon]